MFDWNKCFYTHAIKRNIKRIERLTVFITVDKLRAKDVIRYFRQNKEGFVTKVDLIICILDIHIY